MTRVVLDRNVLVSAGVTPAGACAELLNAGRSGRVEILLTPRLLDDVTAALVQRLSPIDAGRYAWRLRGAGTLVSDPHPSWPAGSLDPGSAHVVALARERDAGAVVTGHGGLLRAGVPGLRVVTPRAMLDELSASRQPGRAGLTAALDRARAARQTGASLGFEPGLGLTR
jgi:predicted nucleic acid-binding protein